MLDAPTTKAGSPSLPELHWLLMTIRQRSSMVLTLCSLKTACCAC